MPNNLKQEIEKEFDKRKNYNAILSKVEGGSMMKSLKYILVPTFAVVLVVGILIGVNQMKKPNETTVIGEEGTTKVAVELKINKLDIAQQTSLDIDLKRIDGKSEEIKELSDEFSFMNSLKLPTDVKLENSYYIYTRSNRDIAKYDVLHDYEFSYKGEEDKSIILTFSKIGKPLRDYYLDEKDEKSKIGDTEVIIQQYKEMYLATFSYNDINFDIETDGITQTELVDLLTSIIK